MFFWSKMAVQQLEPFFKLVSTVCTPTFFISRLGHEMYCMSIWTRIRFWELLKLEKNTDSVLENALLIERGAGDADTGPEVAFVQFSLFGHAIIYDVARDREFVYVDQDLAKIHRPCLYYCPISCWPAPCRSQVTIGQRWVDLKTKHLAHFGNTPRVHYTVNCSYTGLVGTKIFSPVCKKSGIKNILKILIL